MIPQLKDHWEIWYRGEGKKRELFDRRVISQYTNGMQIDWPNVSLIATIALLLLGNTDELDLSEWKVHKGDSASPGKHLRIPCRFDDLKLVIYYQDIVLSVFKRNGYLYR
ncbi:MAG: hypothetical protein C4582_10705 [Desulfobacteraceae bacterium]|jgi:hypothetical protein|nr:MAG: hypothetical protein C4582_10705 [Desulfobacteraceae bacterium]